MSVASGYCGQYVRAQNSFCCQLGPELLGLGEDIVLHQPFRFVRVTRNQQRFTKLVVLRPSRSSTELLVLQHTYWISPVSCFVTLIATDDHSPSCEVNTISERWGGCYDLYPPFPQSVLNNSSMSSR